MSKPVISDFEAGVMVALGALKIAAMQTPGFNIKALEKATKTLKHKMHGISDRAAFELPINCVAADHLEIIDLMNKPDH
ncbi:hypothetical protein [Pseudomonas syringae]|jgi:hypothetical protein|uniref:hypothetical protein n=1 Tax=Pseudomonas syringae TaxID=317 RepID=UPI0013C35F9A|nr:hypothetical protein [Pseudomonas syringae]